VGVGGEVIEEDQDIASQDLVGVEVEGVEVAGSPDYPAGECVFVAEWGTLSAQVRPDGMEACLVAVTPALADSVVDAGKITALLQANHIVSGLLPEKIARVAASVTGIAGWSGKQVVAEGRPPGIPGRLDYTAFGSNAEVKISGVDSWEIDGKGLYFAPLQNFFQQNRSPGEEPTFLGKAIGAGEVVAIRHDPLKGKPGRDIFGRTLKAPAFCELVPGDNINLVDMRQFTATSFGYLLVVNRRLSIFSPIVVADNAMTAWYVNLPQFSPHRQPSAGDIGKLLNKGGVSHGIVHAEISELCKLLEQGAAPVWNAVARGMLAVPGEDGRLEFSVDRDKVAGTIREDGSMDMRDLNLVQTVDGGACIAVLYPPTAGQAGYTLSGVKLETIPGQELNVEAKDNVRVEDGDNGTLVFFAEKPGLVLYQNETITVEPLYLVKGNVDFSTGNIDVDCTLQINGSICSDFIVKCTKNVRVAGAVEPGAKVMVQGDLEVKGGILGETTEVTVLGNLQAGYIQAAKLVVKGEIHVRQYIYVSHVRSIGAIEVGPGSGARGGSIAGGVVCSSSSITAKSCGSPSNVPTTLDLAPHPKQLAALKALKREMKACQAHLLMVKTTLKLETLDLEALQTKFLEVEPGEAKAKAVYAQLLADVKNNLEKLKELSAAKEIVKQEIKDDAAHMHISITHHCYGNTLIRICKTEFLDKNDRGPTDFAYKDGEVVVDPGKADSDK
jgi:hypothetical protein